MKILFVCMSNICRSPYCEYVFRRIVDNDGVLSKNITWIKSAAVFNKSFHINLKAKTALLREGFTEEIGMTRSNKVFLPLKYHKKFALLSTLATGEYKAIPDPVLIKNQDEYHRAMDEIKYYLEKYAENLKSEFSQD